jgi:nitroimidazol reductase NimA-like FMN-containing flavoprotein (pyridoxamine 5'-phosphate oxidase superfamily)
MVSLERYPEGFVRGTASKVNETFAAEYGFDQWLAHEVMRFRLNRWKYKGRNPVWETTDESFRRDSVGIRMRDKAHSSAA